MKADIAGLTAGKMRLERSLGGNTKRESETKIK
jgi:hypothetical protein